MLNLFAQTSRELHPSDSQSTQELQELVSLGIQALSFTLPAESLSAARTAFGRLLRIIQKGSDSVYGIHTHFGADVGAKVSNENPIEHQRALLEYLCIGVGPTLPEQVVRRALRLQCIKIGRGFSGVHPETLDELIALSNSKDLPAVPTFGSLGASGDLVPMAHAVAPIFAKTLPRGPRDVLGLVNTNAINTAFAVELRERVAALLMNGIRCTALNSLALGVTHEAFTGAGLAVNDHLPYPRVIASRISEFREEMLKSLGFTHNFDLRKLGSGFPVQERYSVRCAPQVLGNALENLDAANQKIIGEAWALADNPLVLPADEEFPERMWHGGLFFTSALASAVDLLQDITGRVCEIVNRQTFLLVDEGLSHGLPRNLEVRSGEHVKGVHQLCNALEQSVRAHSVPTRNLSSPAESYNQDIVPCTMAGLHALQNALEPAEHLLRGASFIAERGVFLRTNVALPTRLTLAGWQSGISG